MKQVLLVSIAFPPKKDPECIQTGRYFYYLTQENDLEIDVLTSKSPTLFMPVDEVLSKYDFNYRKMIQVKLFENRYLSYLQRKTWISPLMLPDTKADFHLCWRRFLKKIDRKPELIYSRSYPLSSAILAYKLANHFDVPWVFHLSDPWEDSPLHKYTKSEKKYHAKWELLCFERANHICLTSNKAVNFYANKYPQYKDKISLFPNVFDPEEIIPNPYSFQNKLRIVYTGGLAGTRSPETFMMGLELFNSRNKDSDLLEVVFAGPCDRKMESILNELEIPNFSYVGPLSLEKSLDLQRRADILLIIDSQIKDESLAMFFPSKILEYLSAQRRIMALTTANSSTMIEMDKLGFTSVDIADVSGISDYLELLLRQYKDKNQKYFHIESIPREFSAQENASHLAELFRSL